MSKSAPWKSFERRHAARMGGERIWRQDFGEVAPDGESERDTWDCKCYARHAAISLFLAAERKYKKHAAGRRFHLALFAREHRAGGDFVLLRASDFEDLLRKEAELEGVTSRLALGESPYTS